MRKVLAIALAVLLIFGLPFPVSAVPAPEKTKLAKVDLETKVIVQLEKSSVLIYETQLKEKGLYSMQGIETYANTLKRNLNTVINTAKVRGIDLKTESQYTHSFFGFSASMPFSQVAELEKVPGVKRVFPDVPIYLPKVDYTVPQTKAPYLWNMPGGYTGDGIIVAVIDTGVDVNHLCLQDWSDFPNVVPRVIGCQNYTNDGGPGDVSDVHGHGTHVAGIVAANGEPLAAYGRGDMVGMAPDAGLYAIKVLGDNGRGQSSWVISGIEWAVNPSGGLPRADVINMSLGAQISDPEYPTCLAANAAADAGVIVVAAAGNDGHESATAGAPSVGAKVISVANYGYQQKAFISIEGQEITDVATCDSPEPDGNFYEVVYAGLGKPEDFTGLDLTDKIALVQRGEIAFSEKGDNAAAAGAYGIIVYNNAAGMISMAGEFSIPALSATQAVGEYIRSRMAVVPGLTIAMGVEPARDLINTSSSGGPASDFSLKPDITAPGTMVESLAPGNTTATMSGTSMASPHVAGGVALLKQKYGDTLSVEEYKALLMNSAEPLYDANDNQYPVTVIGAGTMNLENAALSRGIALPASLSLRKDGPNHIFSVRNLSDQPVTYNIHFDSETISASHPGSITVAAHNVSGFSFDATNLDSLPDGPHEGCITLTPTDTVDGHTDVLRIPVYHYVGAHDSFYLHDFQVSESAVYPGQPFDIVFTLTRDVNYMQLGIYDPSDEFAGGWLINGGNPVPAGTWPLQGFIIEDMPAGTCTLELYAEVTDTDYNWLTAEIDVARLEITSPADGSIVNSDHITVTGLAPLPCEVDLYLNDSHCDTAVLVSGGVFSFDVDLDEGPTLIEVLAWDDDYGDYVDYRAVGVVLDTIAPVVEIDAPNDGLVTLQSSLTVSGRVLDTNLATVKVNGTEVNYSPAGEYSTTVTLQPGSNLITVLAEDLAGNTGAETVTVTRGTLPPLPIVIDVPPASDRIAGTNRYSTAVAVSKKGWETAEYVVLARGDNYADALAGAPLAYALNAPILLTESSGLTAVTQAEIQRLRATRVIILGGTSAIGQVAEEALGEMGLTVERITGANRFDTAALIAARVAPTGATKAVLVSGNDFPDALSVAAYAAKESLPILLTQSGSLPAATAQALQNLGVQETVVVGGASVVSNEVLTSVPGATRISGSDRYATSVAAAEYFNPASTQAFIATGLNFADALSGAVLAAKNSSGIFLVGATVPQGLAEYFAEKGVAALMILGGPAGISSQLEESLKALLK